VVPRYGTNAIATVSLSRLMSYVGRYLDPALVETLSHLRLSARRVVEGGVAGLHRSPMRGASIEFRQHRFYSPGDEVRRLDWRLLGRTDRPYIKEYDEETNLRCLLLLDASGSMAYAGRGVSKFDYAAKLVAALAYLMLADGESVGLGVFTRQLDRFVPPRSGTGQLSRLIETLERSSPRGESAIDPVLRAAADRLGRRLLVILISDCFSPTPQLRQGLSRLAHDRHELIVMRLLDADEERFPFKTWTNLRGLEGEPSVLTDPALVRRMYLDNFRQHARELEETCRTLKAELARMLTDEPLVEVLTGFLRRRVSR
jgi:uncharacterized protein (DUF58 family)